MFFQIHGLFFPRMCCASFFLVSASMLAFLKQCTDSDTKVVNWVCKESLWNLGCFGCLVVEKTGKNSFIHLDSCCRASPLKGWILAHLKGRILEHRLLFGLFPLPFLFRAILCQDVDHHLQPLCLIVWRIIKQTGGGHVGSLCGVKAGTGIAAFHIHIFSRARQALLAHPTVGMN